MTNKLHQLFLQNSERSTNGLCIENADSDSEGYAEIFIYDAIGDVFGVESKEFLEEIRAIKAENIRLRINSPGGCVFEAKAIAQAIRSHDAKVTAQIDGLAASAATTIAMAADTVEMVDGSFFMIHEPWTMMMGTADELRSFADVLDKVSGTIAKDYEKKTGADMNLIKQWMADETWFEAADAVEYGFADLIIEEAAPQNKWDLSAYNNAPEKLINVVEDEFDVEESKAKMLQRLRLTELNAA